jgi:hypothetical protein
MAEYSQAEQAAAVAAGVDWLEAGSPEIQLMGRFLDDHGDPSEWSQATADLYEAEHARLMGGAL